MIKTIIVDDEVSSLEMLESYIKVFENEIEICATCRTIDEAIMAIRDNKPELLFLDIDLGTGLSFEILENFPTLKTNIIFITAFDQYILKAIKYHAFDYLFKPINRIELNETVIKVINRIKDNSPYPDVEALISELKGKNNRIAVPNKNGLSYYYINDIIYVEADGSYSIMHLSGSKNITITRKIKDFEKTLVNMGFIRVHKSFLVNIEHISELHRDDSGYLLMNNKAKIPISPKDKESIIQKIKMESNLI